MAEIASGVDGQQVSQWLHTLYAGTSGYAHIACTNNWPGRCFPVDDAGLTDATAYVGLLDRARPAGIYARVTTLREVPAGGNGQRRRRRGSVADSASLPALWGDIDIAGAGHRTSKPLPPDESAAREIVSAAGLPCPSVWIHSGGGLYPIWLLDPPHAVADEAAGLIGLSSAWQAALAAGAGRLGWHYGTAVKDLARLLKIPGTWNRKVPSDITACRLLPPLGRRYPLAELQLALELVAPVPTEPVAQSERREGSQRHERGVSVGDARPGDDFAARVDWEDALLLGGLGWRVVRQVGEYREWLRPDGHSSLSATTGRDGLDNLYVFSDATIFPVEQPLSKLEVFRIIHGHADFAAAVRALTGLGFGRASVRLPEPLQWPDGATVARPELERAAGPSAMTEGEPGSPPTGESPLDDETDDEVDSWEPMDLGPYLRGEVVRHPPSIGIARSDGVRLFYPGLEHAVVGEMEAGKTFLALVSAVSEIMLGRDVLYIHFEEADPGDTVERLLTLGLAPELITRHFHFVGPQRAVKSKQRRRLAELGCSLVVLDGINEGMALHKAAIRDEDGAAIWRRIMVKPFIRRGAAVVSLDHVVKDRESRGRYGLGSIHKGNALNGSLIMLETDDPFGRGLRGASRVFATKDRPGFLRKAGRPDKEIPGKTFMGMFVIDDSRILEDRLLVRFYAPAPKLDDAEQSAATISEVEEEAVMDAIMELVDQGFTPTLRTVRAKAQLGLSKVNLALDRLIVAGRVTEERGERNSRVFTVIQRNRV